MVTRRPRLRTTKVLGGFTLAICISSASCGLDFLSSTTRVAHDRLSTSTSAIDPIEQLILWETQANVSSFLEKEQKVSVAAAGVAADSIALEWLGEPGPHLKSFVVLDDARIRWPKHPYNTSSVVPFLATPTETHLAFDAYFSASRSLFFFLNGDAYTIKLPTNRPHVGVDQPTKAEMDKESRLTVPFSQHIAEVDKYFGRNRNLIVLRDIAMVVDKETNNGYTIRDLRPLQSTGKYYFPGFSFDTLGLAVIKSCTGQDNISKEDFKAFWTKHYSYAAGRAKATLLMRYGVLQTTPNAQNWLVELDAQTMCPTGTMVIRDIVDAKPVLPLATALGYQDFVNEWTARGGVPRRDVDIFESNTLWQSSLEYDQAALSAQRQGFVDGMMDILGKPDADAENTDEPRLKPQDAFNSEALAQQAIHILEAMGTGEL